MAAPQQLTAGDTGGVAVFYAPGPGELPNPGAAFLAAFVGQRVENAKQLLAMRLSAMDPTARYQALADIARTRQANLAQLAASERSRISASSDQDVASKGFLSEMVKLAGVETQAAASVTTARMGLDEARYKARELSPKGQDILTDAQDAISTTVQQLDAARLSGDVAAEDEAIARLTARMGANKRAAIAALGPDERDALGTRVNDLLAMQKLSAPDLQQDLNRVVSGVYDRAPTIESRGGGVRTTSPEEIAGRTTRVMDLLGVSREAAPTGSATVERSTSNRGPAPAPAPREAGAPEGDAASPPLRETAPPAAGGAPSQTDSDIRAELDRNDALMRMIQGYDPKEALGGIYDPYPGARPRGESAQELLRRAQQVGKPPAPKMSMRDRMSQLLGKKPEEEEPQPKAELPNPYEEVRRKPDPKTDVSPTTRTSWGPPDITPLKPPHKPISTRKPAETSSGEFSLDNPITAALRARELQAMQERQEEQPEEEQEPPLENRSAGRKLFVEENPASIEKTTPKFTEPNPVAPLMGRIQELEEARKRKEEGRPRRR